ncbi:helix-turn-helix transcriptional regulator [Paenibacillus nasutitermitis]|uniref:AraC family transcriptional regulator n=1 Tax=Paenibacillus nasutitermitis TaxID=1652958 RepID=A0A917DNV6_9BACL|nr:AraC family transcriptional regulator [Paenibacillus nasutitermitis]GGD56801.1 AraC family transcriptional regulator [Paenibacillus nasutitermitis]
MNDALGELHNMVPHFSRVVHRKVNGSWVNPRKVWETHSFILVYDGEAVIGCNEEHHVSKGDLIYFKPGDVRWGYTFENNPMKCYGMDFQYSCLLYDNDHWYKKDIPLPINSFLQIKDTHLFSRILSLFQSLSQEWVSPNTFNKVIKERAYYMEILNLLFLWHSSKQSLNYDKIRKVDKVSQYILENYTHRIKMQELSNYIQISKSYLQVMFKEITGSTPIEYLIQVRINKAKELIKEGYYNIREVSELVGFNDAFYFSKCFKKNEGMSPKDYRSIVSSQKQFV